MPCPQYAPESWLLFQACAFVFLLSGSVCAETLSIDLGTENHSDGLVVPSSGDGENRPESIAGSSCRTISGANALYMYVHADNARIPKQYDGVYLAVEYFDAELGVALVQYDRHRPGGDIHDYYFTADDLIVMTGSGRWQRSIVHLPGAQLAHQQNGKTDLRIWCKDLAVRRIEVAFEWDAAYWPGGLRPEVLDAIRTTTGPGVEVTFGAGTSDISATRLPLLKAIGATSVESYVTWQSCEAGGEGQWDWSRWDRQVAEIRKAGLKWVPLLIAGPAYATPRWFRESNCGESYVCLEHNERTQIQSIWNPGWRIQVDRFIKAFAERYGDRDIIESVMLGISGIYGETLYPTDVPPDDTIAMPFPFHCHSGWWAGDRFAILDFRRFVRMRYADIASLNRAWNSTYESFEQIVPVNPKEVTSTRMRVDFISWYETSMTDAAAFWASATRKYLPRVPIYMSVGGSGQPSMGADFTAIARAIAPFNAGIRITNEGDDFAHNFTNTGEVATATRAFGTYHGNEPAGRLTDQGNVTRIANAVACGARQWFSYSTHLLNHRRGLKLIRDHIQFMRGKPPIIHAGFYLPKTSWIIDDLGQERSHRAAAQIRDFLDLELVDYVSLGSEKMGSMGVLGVTDAPTAEVQEIGALRRWVSEGHILVAAAKAGQPMLRTPEASDAPASDLFAKPAPDATPIRYAVDGVPPRNFRLEIGKPGDDRYLFGDWYSPERGAEFPKMPDSGKRWTSARAGLRLPCDPSSGATLILHAQLLQHSLLGENRVLINGTELGRITETGARELRFDIPKELLSGQTVATVVLEIQTFDPTKFGSADTRRLGLAVACVQLCAKGAENERPQPATLVSSVDWDVALKQCVRRIGRGATILLPEADSGALGAAMIEILEKPQRLVPGLESVSLPIPRRDGIYASETADGVLLYNSNSSAVRVGSGEIPARGMRFDRR